MKCSYRADFESENVAEHSTPGVEDTMGLAKGREGEYHLAQMKDLRDHRGALITEADTIEKILNSDSDIAKNLVLGLLNTQAYSTKYSIESRGGWSKIINDPTDLDFGPNGIYEINEAVLTVGRQMQAIMSVAIGS